MYITEKNLLKVALFCNAFYVYILLLFKPDGINLGKLVVSSLLILSLVSLFLIILRNRKRIYETSRGTRRLFYLLIAYSFIVVIRSFTLSLQDWVTNFGNVYMALAWFTPLMLIVGLKIENWIVVYKTVNFMFILMVVAMILHLLNISTPREEWNWLFRPVNFILLTVFYKYKLVNKFIIIIILALYSYVAVYTRFRFEFIYLSLVGLFLIFDRLSSIKFKKWILKYIIVGFISMLIYVFTFGYESFSSFIAFFIEFQDSRTFLFTELFADLNTMEECFGRGSLGTYYSDFFERTNRWYRLLGNKGWRGDNVIRITTEVGFLQMILKGGYALLILYTSLVINSIYLALFKSNNKFIKRLGFYILIILILSIISLRPAFTPTFIILWMAIGTVSVKKYRDMSNKEIDSLIKSKTSILTKS